jgi:23S rRNA pseudouridine1911/1915/1917 synthase
MHQIRVHMAHIGCPLIWDRRYVPSRRKPTDKELLRHIYNTQTPVRGHLLHAHQIEFEHPYSGRSVHLNCPWELLGSEGKSSKKNS